MQRVSTTQRPGPSGLLASWVTTAFVLLPALAGAAALKPGDFVMVTWSGLDSPCCRVLSVDATSLAVSEITTGGYIVDPQDIAVSAQGDILVSVPSAGIVSVDPASGAQSIFTSPEGLGGGTPAGILATTSGIYVTIRGSEARVALLNLDGSLARIVSAGGLLAYPAGLALGPDGALYVCETIPFGAVPGGALVRVDPASGAQTAFASGDPLHGPFEAAFAPDGSLWSIQRGYLLHETRGWLVRTRLADGFSEQVPFGFDFLSGIAIGPDGLTIIADCAPVHSSCQYSYTRVYPDGPYVTWNGGPIAVVPEMATPATTTTWGRLKVIYR